ncbi:photosystem II complex extrinsic protein PsbU [Tumidithrix helvetica PCC 7403]|uniref:Photosystem II complex extrinsic protein PsbU n=1 Tax=Tumidithrix elongata BACA0141 TaxID=2716417 RepID=A0AAW9Q070_9CYAN|nr:photosystem II complex extrinsic protein PsbU [Tumidithrix elongata RA019]
MKALVRFSVLILAIAVTWTFGLIGNLSPSVLADQLPDTSFIKQDISKIDLNNANINAFRKVKGMYPTLGRIIVENAPYDSLDDVLNISGLTDTQKQTIRDNAGVFTLNKPDNSMNRERINNSVYRL